MCEQSAAHACTRAHAFMTRRPMRRLLGFTNTAFLVACGLLRPARAQFLFSSHRCAKLPTAATLASLSQPHNLNAQQIHRRPCLQTKPERDTVFTGYPQRVRGPTISKSTDLDRSSQTIRSCNRERERERAHKKKPQVLDRMQVTHRAIRLEALYSGFIPSHHTQPRWAARSIATVTV